MKKLLLTTALITSITSAALAKTEGSQVGVNLIGSSIKYESSSTYRSVGFGVNYKHAFAFDNGIFIAPGVFVERIGNDKKLSESGSVAKINDRFGAKLDVGYDITDAFAIYANAGVASTGYKMDLIETENDVITSREIENGRKTGLVYGLGIAYNINKNLALNLEYDYQQLNLSKSKIKTDLSALKVGLAYRF